MAAADTSPDAGRLLRTRGLRALVDGLVAVVLPSYLLARGSAPTQVGAVVTATLLGSAAVTLTIGLRGGRFDRVHLLQLMAVLMIGTGLAFGLVAAFGALLVVAARRHDQPVVGRRQRLPARSSRRCCPTPCRPPGAPTSSPATASWPRWPAPSARWPRACRAGWPTTPTSRSSTPSAASSSSTRWPGVVLLLAYRRLAPAPAGRWCRASTGAGSDARRADRAAALGPLQRRRLRRRLRRAVDPRALAVAPLRPLHRASPARCSSGAGSSRPARRSWRRGSRRASGSSARWCSPTCPPACCSSPPPSCPRPAWRWPACWPARSCRRWTCRPARAT